MLLFNIDAANKATDWAQEKVHIYQIFSFVNIFISQKQEFSSDSKRKVNEAVNKTRDAVKSGADSVKSGADKAASKAKSYVSYQSRLINFISYYVFFYFCLVNKHKFVHQLFVVILLLVYKTFFICN